MLVRPDADSATVTSHDVISEPDAGPIARAATWSVAITVAFGGLAVRGLHAGGGVR